MGTGDCVLLNFETGVFAVSDSSDRAPGQSREFLLQFDNMVSLSSRGANGSMFRATEVREIAEQIKLGCEKILEAMRGSASCTFTGIHILKTDSWMNALLFHTGDSCLYEYDPLKRTMTVLTVNNFWMIGKTVKLYQTTELSVKPSSIFILATDGVGSGTSESTQRNNIAEIVQCSEVEDIPDKMMHTDISARGLRDDAAVIALASRSLQPVKARIIMGGTTAQEEREYSDRCRSMFYMDSHVHVTETSARVDHVF
ncbi:MAG: SpoIIE family protein phosphatase [Desulfomonile tiedjei]|uniref:SpoIIE family protein phosphatase n=1 Tax=Desulfomonile tiedjei TaxID=2358 RepID=A0A9D6UX86_9BACT|nr:SpoIIE family protein phosphatase [Desulfomonile tiedjei]